MDVIEELRKQHQKAVAQYNELQQRNLEIGQRIREAIQQAADLAVRGEDPTEARQRVRELRDEAEELPYYLRAAQERVYTTELALVLAEMEASEKRSAAIRPKLEAARQEQAEIAQRVKRLTVEADSEGNHLWRLMDRRAQAERALAEIREGTEEAPELIEAPSTRAYPREATIV